ncbi:hypothetical protein LXL04_034072 [Taraxacum kok-saghyz]
MLRLKAFRPTNDKIVKIQLHPTHPWLVTADASDHVSVWNWEHRQDWQLWRNRSAAAEPPSAVNQLTSAFNSPAPSTKGRHFLDLVTMRGRDVPKQDLDNRSLVWQHNIVSVLLVIALSLCISSAECLTGDSIIKHSRSVDGGLCFNLNRPCDYTCLEHTKIGLRFKNMQSGYASQEYSYLCSGDAWFMDSSNESLGFILADRGFDVWVGNVCGTKLSHGHQSLSEGDKEFWDWIWEEMALYDLETMLSYINSKTSSKVFVVGHSQGTIMLLAAFTQPNIVKMVEVASLLSHI